MLMSVAVRGSFAEKILENSWLKVSSEYTKVVVELLREATLVRIVFDAYCEAISMTR